MTDHHAHRGPSLVSEHSLINSPEDIGAQCFAEDLATLGMTARELSLTVGTSRWLDWSTFLPTSVLTHQASWFVGYRRAATYAIREAARRAALLSLGCEVLDAPHRPGAETVCVDCAPGPEWQASVDAVRALGQSFLGLSADEEHEYGARYLDEWIAEYGPAEAMRPATDDDDPLIEEMERRHER